MIFCRMQPGYCTTIIGSIKPDLTSQRNFVCLDTRSREVRDRQTDASQLLLVIREYSSSVWQEYFIAWEDNLWYLYGFVRLLLPSVWYDFDYEGVWDAIALIRELHVYGQVSKIGESDVTKTQHGWLGKQLIDVAEKIAYHKWYRSVTVISGVGVKWYYRKLWFQDLGTYMNKSL